MSEWTPEEEQYFFELNEKYRVGNPDAIKSIDNAIAEMKHRGAEIKRLMAFEKCTMFHCDGIRDTSYQPRCRQCREG